MRALALLLPVALMAAGMQDHYALQRAGRQAAGVDAQTGQPYPPARLRHDPSCLLDVVLRRKNLARRPEIPLPPVLFESSVDLRRFQDAVEDQWGQRPPLVSNAYSLKTGEIFLIDDPRYYSKLGRFIDDSLVHELAHFVQVKYQGANLMDDPYGSYESDAVDVQTWFRTDVHPSLTCP